MIMQMAKQVLENRFAHYNDHGILDGLDAWIEFKKKAFSHKQRDNIIATTNYL